MKKQVTFFVGLLIISVIIVGVFVVNAAVTKTGSVKYHSANEISGIFDNNQETLDSAITNGRLINDKNAPKSLSKPPF